MTSAPPGSETLHHHTRRMAGRDPHEAHRVATPLELLFDLTFVMAFGQAAAEFAHALAAGHYMTAILGFGFASFAICWAWINFSWFSSAYDTDDWIYRLVTMMQMIGVLVLAIGLPRMFASIEHGAHLDNSVMVLGYVIMRIALVSQWLRAARQDPSRRDACLTYVIALDRADRLDRADPGRLLAVHLARPRPRPSPHRTGRTVDRRAQGRRDALAPAPHRRTL